VNEKIFKEGISYLQVFYGKTLGKGVIGMYGDHLKHLPDEIFKIACKKVIKNFVPTSTVPFPLVPHFLKYCGEGEDDRAIAAISILKRAIRKVGPYHSIIFKDAALNYAVNAYGGWVAVCNWVDKDWDINEQRLINTYKVASIGGFKDICHLPGISEKEPNGFFKLHFIKKNGDTWGANEYNAETLAIALGKMQNKIGVVDSGQVKEIDDIVKKCLPGVE
jgi:hypothetical protein